MTRFRIHFSDGDVVDVSAKTPNAARDEARSRKGGGIVSKVKVVRENVASAPALVPSARDLRSLESREAS